MFEGIGIPSRAFWVTLELLSKGNGNEDYKVLEAFITQKLFLIYKNLLAEPLFSHSISILADAYRKAGAPAY